MANPRSDTCRMTHIMSDLVISSKCSSIVCRCYLRLKFISEKNVWRLHVSVNHRFRAATVEVTESLSNPNCHLKSHVPREWTLSIFTYIPGIFIRSRVDKTLTGEIAWCESGSHHGGFLLSFPWESNRKPKWECSPRCRSRSMERWACGPTWWWYQPPKENSLMLLQKALTILWLPVGHLQGILCKLGCSLLSRSCSLLQNRYDGKRTAAPCLRRYLVTERWTWTKLIGWTMQFIVSKPSAVGAIVTEDTIQLLD